MTTEQFIVLCLEDIEVGSTKGPRYVMATRRRFDSSHDAYAYSQQIASERMAVTCPVPAVEVDVDGYPQVFFNPVTIAEIRRR